MSQDTMLRRSITVFVLVLLATTVRAQEEVATPLPSVEQLTGEWNNVARAPKDSPDERTSAGGIIEFRADGTLLNKTGTRTVEGTYALDGDTITLTFQGGKEQWTIRSFEPGKSLVAESGPWLSFLER